MKKLLKITLTLFITTIIVLGFAMPLNPAGNWYQQFLPNIGGRTILDITFLDSLTGYAITNISSDTSYVLKTTNGGDSWIINHRAASTLFRKVQFISFDTGYIGGQHLLKTTNAGNNWYTVYSSLFADDMHILNKDTAWFVRSESLTGGVFRTTNGGANWTQQLNIGNQNPNHIYMYNGRIGFICEDNTYLRKTTNSGLNWSVISGAGGFTDMHFADSLTGWKTSFQKTTNGGLNWINQTLPSGGIILSNNVVSFSNLGSDTIWATGGTAFYGAGQFRGIIYRTTNSGNNWLFQVPDTTIHSGTYQHIQFVNNRMGWAYWPVSGVHTTNGGDTQWLVGITQVSSQIPRDYKLYQNYPNPFNPKTNIKYQLTKSEHISIIVYDITGKQVIDLVNRKQTAGVYEVDFAGYGISSGVYLYSLIADGSLVDTKKMILIK